MSLNHIKKYSLTISFFSTNERYRIFLPEYILKFKEQYADEAAARRINSMNQRLMELEMQMQLLETEICKVNGPYHL